MFKSETRPAEFLMTENVNEGRNCLISHYSPSLITSLTFLGKLSDIYVHLKNGCK